MGEEAGGGGVGGVRGALATDFCLTTCPRKPVMSIPQLLAWMSHSCAGGAGGGRVSPALAGPSFSGQSALQPFQPSLGARPSAERQRA